MNIDELEGVELDEAVHTSLGKEPRRDALAMSEDGLGYCARTNTAGPWYTPGDLREWLLSEQGRGRYQGYYIVTKPTYPQYHRNIAQAWELVDVLEAEGYSVQLHNRHNGDKWRCLIDPVRLTRFIGEGKSAAVAICRAFLKAKGAA